MLKQFVKVKLEQLKLKGFHRSTESQLAPICTKAKIISN